MTDVAVPETNSPNAPAQQQAASQQQAPALAPSALVQWAYEAQQAAHGVGPQRRGPLNHVEGTQSGHGLQAQLLPGEDRRGDIGGLTPQ